MNVEHALLHLKQDEKLRPLLENIDMPVKPPSGKIYLDLLDSIVSQQLSGKVATVIFNRFCDLFPDRSPHPDLVAAMSIEELRSIGLSNQKAAYMQNVARFALEFPLENYKWEELTDDEIVALLTQIKGVGRWTVQMLLMFSLGRPDVFPLEDYGIQQAMIRLFQLDETGTALKKRMEELSAPWRPYRTVASRYLWRWKDGASVVLPDL